MKKILEDDFIEFLSEDTIEASRAIVQRYNEWQKPFIEYFKLTEEDYQGLLDFLGFLKSFIEIHELKIDVNKPELDKENDYKLAKRIIKNLNSEITDYDRQNSFRSAYKNYSALIPGGHIYEFLDSDFNHLQELINELRTLTRESDQLDEDHRRRLLRRIEKVQIELNKKMSSLDVFWGMLGEAGVVLGKFGENIKPLTDRVSEILKIVYKTEGRAGGLPPGKEPPLLSAVQGITEQNVPADPGD